MLPNEIGLVHVNMRTDFWLDYLHNILETTFTHTEMPLRVLLEVFLFYS